MDDLEQKALRLMARHGGRFARPLAQAWLGADSDNPQRLQAAFGDLLEPYKTRVLALETTRHPEDVIAEGDTP